MAIGNRQSKRGTSLKPLVFLAKRSFVNRIRRSFTSPKRTISLVALVAYYFWLVMRPMATSYGTHPTHFPREFGFHLPPLDMIQAFVFAGFAVLTLLLALSTSVQRLSFRPADVDVLFATPLSPRLILLFRFCRDYLVSLLIPLLPLIFGWRASAILVESMMRDLPHSAGYVPKVASLAWLLVALTWVSISYALSLFINRSDLVSDRNKRVIVYGGSIAFLALAGYSAWRFSSDETVQGFVNMTHDPILRTALFTATAASNMVMAPLRGDWLPFVTSLFGLLAISAGAVLIAMSQAGWMYDQAAARGFDSLRIKGLQQKGDFVGMAAERARSRKGKVRSFNWLMRIKVRGPLAIIWREVIIQLRMAPMMLIMFAALGIMFGIIPMVSGQGPKDAGFIFLGMQGMTVFVGSMSISQSGFIELLRRVDIEKPLPFTPSAISFAEVAAKALPSTLSIIIASIVCTVIQPALWPYSLACVVGLPFIAILCCSIIFLVTLIFPDIDDASLRGFRGLVIMLGLLIALVPVAALGIGIFFLASSLLLAPVIAAAVSAAAAIGVSIIVSLVSGGLYAQFNPSE